MIARYDDDNISNQINLNISLFMGYQKRYAHNYHSNRSSHVNRTSHRSSPFNTLPP